jgi:hypothetical protein
MSTPPQSAVSRLGLALVPLAALTIFLLTAVSLYVGNLGGSGMHLASTLGISTDLAKTVVQLVVSGLGWLVASTYPPAAPLVNQILDMVRTVGFDAAVQW